MELRDGSWWFADRQGGRFLSLGVCCVNQGHAPEKWSAINPGYSALKLYPAVTDWSRATQRNLTDWGFNTVGSWSDHNALVGGLYHTPVLHLISNGIPWVDMWDSKVIDETTKFAESEIAKWRGDPRVLGYFSDNELGWWYGAMFDWAFKATPKFGTRKRLVDLLRNRYGSDWSRVLKDFDPEGAASFETLEQSGKLFLRPGGEGFNYVKDVMHLLAARYYELCRDVIKKADPGALFLGDRYISNFYPEVAEEAGKIADVVSTNLNASWADGGIYRYFLDELYRVSKKPILITEFYQCAMENRSGNMNDASGFPTVRTQRERAKAAANQVRKMLGKPYVVGAHWFQFYDEPMHGRDDGENYNMGLVDTGGRPYDGLTRVFAKGRFDELHGKSAAPRPGPKSVLEGIPSVDAIAARDLLSWPRDRAYVAHSAGDARGDLYVAWHPSGLFVGLAWDEDRFAEGFYRGDRLPAEDRAKLTIVFRGVKSPVEATMGLGGDLELSGASRIAHLAGTRCFAIFRVPANTFGNARLEKGDKVSFAGTFLTRARAYRMTWIGDFELK